MIVIRYFTGYSPCFLTEQTISRRQYTDYLKTVDIESESEVFAIKLFGVSSRSSILILLENGKYFIRSFRSFLARRCGYAQFPIDGSIRRMPANNFRHKYKEEWEDKRQRRILLVNSVSMEFRYHPLHGSERIVEAGDIVNGMEIDSLPRLLKDLEMEA